MNNILQFQSKLKPVTPQIGKRYKTTKGYIAIIVEHKPRGEFYAVAEIKNKLGTRSEGRAYYNSVGEVQGMQSFYGFLW